MDPIWKEVLCKRFVHFPSFSYSDDRLEAVEDPPGTIATDIPILFDGAGCPEVPTITNIDGHLAKPVQNTLRAYCLAHIRASSSYLVMSVSNAS